MTPTRESLEHALAVEDKYDRQGAQRSNQHQTLVDAARKQLALMPRFVDEPECGDCDHLPRKVYPAELMKRIADTIGETFVGNGRQLWLVVVAVLDTLNGDPP